MTLNDIVSRLGASLLPASSGQAERARSTAPSVAEALDRAGQRIEAQQSSTEVRLSAFGQLRSAVAGLRDSSTTLSTRESTDTPEKARAAAEQFVSAFNTAQTTAARTINGKPKASTADTERNTTDGVLSGDSRANVAASQLSRTLDNASTDALRSIGINRERNGTLSVDQQRFSQALQDDPQAVSAALAQVGRQVEQTSSSQLEDGANLDRAVANLSRQSRQFEAQQAALQAFAETSQKAAEQATSSLNLLAANGIRAYEKIFAL